MITPIIVPMEVAVNGETIPMDVSTENEINMGIDAQYNPVVIETNFPPGGLTGDLLAKKSDADFEVEWITPANSPEQDNTRPITAAAVYTEIGNINALLATI